jgi:hypothetical protein
VASVSTTESDCSSALNSIDHPTPKAELQSDRYGSEIGNAATTFSLVT